MYSEEHKNYLKQMRKDKIIVTISKIMILLILLIAWELLAYYNIINSFLSSSPSKIVITIVELFKNNDLILHIWVTFYETIISFLLATIIGVGVASMLWTSKRLFKIIDPYLTILNSLPKVSLGPLIIILLGANPKSIIIMALLISTFTTIISMYNAFISTDENK